VSDADTEYCHVDGTLLPAEEAAVSVRDRGFTYGDAVFERLRVYGGEPFEWAAHVDRLERSAERLDFDEALPPRDDLRDRVTETLDANDCSEAAVRLSVSRGVQGRDLTPDTRVDPTITVVVDDLPRGGTDGERVWDEPATLRTVETRRPPEEALPSEVKTHSYLNGVLARLDLPEDADEALVRSMEGHVTGGAGSNLFLVHNGTLYTPTANLPLLPGVTRGVVLDIAGGESFPVETGRYTVTDVREADELFLTNSTWEVRPVTEIDGYEKPVGPITKLCGRLFDRRVERVHY
jgi:branched-chain amino acid aminotransferase